MDIQENLQRRINLVLGMYRRAIEEDILLRDDVSLKFKSVQLDVLQYGDQGLYDRLEDRLHTLPETFDVTQLNEQLECIKSLSTKLHGAMELVFDELKSAEIHEV